MEGKSSHSPAATHGCTPPPPPKTVLSHPCCVHIYIIWTHVEAEAVVEGEVHREVHVLRLPLF